MTTIKKLFELKAWIVLMTFFFILAAVASAQTQQQPIPVRPQGGIPPKVPGKCCIAGEYEGYRKDALPPTKSCPKPEEGPFKMVIYQAERCGSKIWGKVTGEDGSVQEFSGSVTPGTEKGCCNINGETTKKPGEVTRFKGTLCLKGGKWMGKGTYTTQRVPEGIVCNGTWEMKQM